jgi:hypothetical protein
MVAIFYPYIETSVSQSHASDLKYLVAIRRALSQDSASLVLVK